MFTSRGQRPEPHGARSKSDTGRRAGDHTMPSQFPKKHHDTRVRVRADKAPHTTCAGEIRPNLPRARLLVTVDNAQFSSAFVRCDATRTRAEASPCTTRALDSTKINQTCKCPCVQLHWPADKAVAMDGDTARVQFIHSSIGRPGQASHRRSVMAIDR